MAWKIFGIILLFLFFVATPASANSETVADISDQLICQCGCTLVLSNCTHAECGSREVMTTFIRQELDGGQSGPQIIQTLVSQYGEQVLSSPPKRGFNLVAWVLPFAAILGGAVVIYIALKKWVWRGTLTATLTNDEVDERYEEYDRQLERELREFTGGGFR